MSKSAILLIANGCQSEEWIYPYYRLQEAGFVVYVVASGELSKYKGKKCVKDKYRIPTIIDDTTHNLWKFKPEIVIIPGGWQCPEILRMDSSVAKFIYVENNKGTIIGAICHGPQVLISAGICKDRYMTGYLGIKDDIMNAGANYIDAPVVVDDNIVTSPHYKNNPEFMREILKFHAVKQEGEGVIH